MKTSVTITVEVRETRSVRRHRHLSHEHRQKIGQSQRERLEFYRRTKEAEKPKWTPYAARVEAFTSLQEYATAMQNLLAKAGMERVTVNRKVISFI